MKGLNKIPWQIKLIVLMLFMAILPSILISYNLTVLVRNELTSSINSQLSSSARSISSSINSKIKKSTEIIDLLQKTIENPTLSSEEIISFMVSNTEKIDNILSLSLIIKEHNKYSTAISSEKEFIIGSDNKLTPVNNLLATFDLKNLAYDEKQNSNITTPKFNRNLKLWTNWIIKRVNIKNMPQAFLVVQINLTEIAAEIENDLLNRIGSLFILDIDKNKFLSSKVFEDIPQVIYEEAIKGLVSGNKIEIVNNYDEQNSPEYVVSFSYPQEVNWVVVSSIRRDSAYAEVDQSVINLGLFVGISALLSIIIALLFSRHISKPIVKMANNSQLIANGNFDINIEYKAKDSIGLLNNSLSKMGSQLKKNFLEIEFQKNQLEDYSKNLEKKVEERTNELNESNKELKKAYKRVLELNEEKNEFLGIAAHDLKNPLTAISAFAGIIKEDKDLTVEQHDDFLGEIIKASDRMFFIVKNLLDVNAIEQGKLNTKMQRVSLKSVTKELIAQFQDATNKKNIVLYESYENDDLEVIADYNLTLQVVQNILSNAIKFSPPSKNIYLLVKISSQPENIDLVIKDEGPGFNEEDKKKLFTKFARLSARPTGGEHSTGLGLSIVKKLVEMMNGTIRLESESGKGAQFIISFPRATEDFQIDE